MTSILYKNNHLAKLISKFVDAARDISTNRYAEGRCGSMILDVTSFMPKDSADKVAISPEYPIGETMPNLKHRYFYTTAAKCSLEQYSRTPMEYSSIIRITESCDAYEAIADNLVKFPDDLTLALHAYNMHTDPKLQSICLIHTYPLDLTITMMKLGNDTKKFIELGQELSPDQVWTFKKGFISIPKDGNPEFMQQVSEALSNKINVFVPKHGLFTFGVDPLAASDKICALNHIAKLINKTM